MKPEELLKKLIEIYSPSGEEKKLAEFILAYCKENGIPAHIQNGNVVIFLKGKENNKCMIFNAHMDTVKTGLLKQKVINGKLYGLGASDDKGAIVSQLLLAKSLQNPPIDLWFSFVCNEETDGSGSEKFIKYFKTTEQFKNYKKIIAIIGEPTNLTHLEIGHRGNVFIKLETFGKTGHGAKAYKQKEKAITKMIQIILQLEKEFKIWKKKYKDSILGEPSMNITSINTNNSSVNKTPKSCSVALDFRTTPVFHKQILQLLKNVLTDTKISFVEKSVEPAYISPNNELIKKMKDLFPKASISISTGSTDQSLFITNGIDAIVFGPGKKEVIHTENEYIYIKNLIKAKEMYETIVYG